MKKITIQRVGIILFCTVLIGSGILTVGVNIEDIKNKTYKSVEAVYNIDHDTEDLLKGAISGIDNGIDDNVFGKDPYINIYGLVERLLGKHYLRDANEEQNIYKDNNGQLQFIVSHIDTTNHSKAIADTHKLLEDKSIPMVYVQTPVKVIEGYTKVPAKVDDYTKRNTETFKDALVKEGVPFLDLREYVGDMGIPYNELFYNTDHHWRTQTAFWSVGKTVEYIEENTDLVLDPNNIYTNIENYDSTIYEDSFLGSQGRRVGKYYGGVDDYELLTPKFDTDYKVTIKKGSIDSVTEGSFDEAIVKKHMLKGDDICTNRYAAYWAGDYSEIIAENKLAQNDLKVLVIKDSFGLPFSAFLSTMFAETRLLDTRYYTGTVEEYINSYNPDLVLYVYKSINTQK